MRNRSARATRPLRLLQINVGKGSSNHELALSISYEQKIDIIMIQEPYIYSGTERRITKRHPAYECFTPVDIWSNQPRVLTYVRKGVGLRAEQLRLVPPTNAGARDLLFLSLLTPYSSNLLIINIYNAPPGSLDEGSALSSLLQLPNISFPSSTFIAGDFNLHHPVWQPSYSHSTSAAEPFVSWIEQARLSLTSEVDIPTHRAGNTIDLAFASTSLIELGTVTSVAKSLDTTSDHFPLYTEIPWDIRFQEEPTRLKPKTLDPDLFMKLLGNNLRKLSLLSESPNNNELDTAAQELSSSIRTAYAGSAARALGKGTGVPWWSKECSEAVHIYRQSGRTLRRSIRRAKTQYFRDRLNTASSARETFQMTKWHRSNGSFRSPPLTDPTRPDRPVAYSLAEKREVLIANLLQNPAEAEDVPLTTPTVPRKTLPFPEITRQELSKAVLEAANTAPGEDEITTEVLKIGWPLLEPLVLDLFQKCLAAGYHPSCFRTAILLILSKPNKPDKTSPRAYRPIALLSVLGKGLERLLARRMSWLAIKHKVLAKQQFGALPCRSAVDLTTCLTHDVESALKKGLTASMATLDVKGAFDGVLSGRLVCRLREQGWPHHLVQWVASFTTGRSVRVRLDGSIGPKTEISCGLPQGSPISPILFMLYIAPLLAMGSPKRRFGYADDVALVHISPSLEENSQALSNSIAEALEWGHAEGITFDASKSELIHFSRRSRDKAISPSVMAGPLTISENPSKPYLRWLGVLFDRKLTFKWHVQTQASKALKISNAMASLGNTARGVPPNLLRQAAVACVLPVAYYAAETWWPGRSRPGSIKPISNRTEGLLKRLDRVVLNTARAILPVYRTTPTAALHRESGLPPSEISLNHIALAASTRLKRLDPQHPLLSRYHDAKRPNQPDTRFTRRAYSLPDTELVNPLILPPWEEHTHTEGRIRVGAPLGVSKEEAAEKFAEFIRGLPSGDLIVFSDGSKLDTGLTGAGYAIYQGGIQIAKHSISLGKHKEVFDAEAIAALAGLEAALKLPTTRFATNLWVCLDNLEVAIQLSSPSSKGSSQQTFLRFAELAPQWARRARLAHTSLGEVRIRWVPGHTNILGNEMADKAAKEGASLALREELPYSLASLKRWAKTTKWRAIAQYWQTAAPKSYQALGITSSPPKPKELDLPRASLGRILAARSQHGDFADYHERFCHENAYLYCRCGARKAPLHFAFCSIAKRFSRRKGDQAHNLIELLSSSLNIADLANWLKRTRFYTEICPTFPRTEE